MSVEFSYRPDGATLEAFLTTVSRVAVIQGPWGSGKSTVCCYKLLGNALNQKPDTPGPSGVRRRRTYVCRNTFDELNRTTIKTWEGVFPPERFGAVKRSKPFEHRIRIASDGKEPALDWEITFLAMDDEADRKKLLSAEVSDIWFNEMREIPRAIVDDADGRIDRFPAVKDGGCTNAMMIGDTNAPAEDHWISIMSGQVPMPEGLDQDQLRALTRPERWRFFIQPPGMVEVRGPGGEVGGYAPNPAAENVRWLAPGYYPNLISGKTRAWIRVNVLNRPGQLVAGKPVWPLFRVEFHVAHSPLVPIANVLVHVGVDFGRTPAAIMGQRNFDRWFVQRELVAEGMGAKTFAGLLKRQMAEWFPGMKFTIYGDPTGDELSQSDDSSPFRMFRAAGLEISPAPTNDPTIRIGTVEELLKAVSDGGTTLVPRFTLSPLCTVLKAAMEGGYHYRRLQVTGEQYSPEPQKNRYSHPADALQYMLMGAGEGRALLNQAGRSNQSRQTHAITEEHPQGRWSPGGNRPTHAVMD